MKYLIWISRILIGLVALINLQCAVQFITQPVIYAHGFEIQGTPGIVIVQSLGILFVMWNVPYIFAAFHPIRFFSSLIQAVIMQSIGLVGETMLLLALPPGHIALRATAHRFILFDAVGLLLLLIAFFISFRLRRVNEDLKYPC